MSIMSSQVAVHFEGTKKQDLVWCPEACKCGSPSVKPNYARSKHFLHDNIGRVVQYRRRSAVICSGPLG